MNTISKDIIEFNLWWKQTYPSYGYNGEDGSAQGDAEEGWLAKCAQLRELPQVAVGEIIDVAGDGRLPIPMLQQLVNFSELPIGTKLFTTPQPNALVEALEKVLEVDGGLSCGCINKSRELEIAYETYSCPHQLAAKLLATNQSNKGD